MRNRMSKARDENYALTPRSCGAKRRYRTASLQKGLILVVADCVIVNRND